MVKARHLAVTLALLAPALDAAAQAARPFSAAPAPVVSGGSLLQVSAALLLVLAAVAGLAWILKRIAPRQLAQGGALRVVSATAVGQRERVVVIEIGDTWLVTGVAPGRVSALHTLPRPASTPARNETPHGGATGFSGWLKQTLDKKRHA